MAAETAVPVIACAACLPAAEEKNFFFAGVARSKSVRGPDDGIGPSVDEVQRAICSARNASLLPRPPTHRIPTRAVLHRLDWRDGHLPQHERRADPPGRSRRVVLLREKRRSKLTSHRPLADALTISPASPLSRRAPRALTLASGRSRVPVASGLRSRRRRRRRSSGARSRSPSRASRSTSCALHARAQPTPAPPCAPPHTLTAPASSLHRLKQ